MSIFRKITETVSKGVTTATEKAQQTVEITRVNSQISGKRKEIERHYAAIGEAVFEAYKRKDLSLAESKAIPACLAIEGLLGEIDALEERIMNLRNEKECECGRKVPYDTRFCPSCGHKFPEPVVHEAVPVHPVAEAGEPAAEAPETASAAPELSAPEPEKARNCVVCAAELDPDTRFCPSCGAAQSNG